MKNEETGQQQVHANWQFLIPKFRVFGVFRGLFAAVLVLVY
jgi:hypothetical protein